MPFKSEAQRRYLWANEPEIARDWADTYGSKIQAAQGGRIGYYAGGQSIPSEYTIEDARKTAMQDRLGGITDVMKQADLYRQGDVGQMYMADGGIMRLPFRSAGAVGAAHGNAAAAAGAVDRGGDDRSSELAMTSNYIGPAAHLDIQRPDRGTREQNFNQSRIRSGMLGGPSFLGNIGGNIKNYITGGGLIGMAGRGLKSLGNWIGNKGFSEQGEPYGNAWSGIHNYNKTFKPTLDRGGDYGGIIPMMPQYYRDYYNQQPGVIDDTVIDDTVADDWEHFYRGEDITRQDKGALDDEIYDYVSTLYT